MFASSSLAEQFIVSRTPGRLIQTPLDSSAGFMCAARLTRDGFHTESNDAPVSLAGGVIGSAAAGEAHGESIAAFTIRIATIKRGSRTVCGASGH